MALGDVLARIVLVAGIVLLVLGLALAGLGYGVATEVGCEAGTVHCFPFGSLIVLVGLGCVGVGLLLTVPAFVFVRRQN